MSSKREQVLQAFYAKLLGLQKPQVSVYRNMDKPQKVPDGGIIILRDGESGDPDVMLSPLTYIYEHIATLEVMAQHTDQDKRTSILDALLVGIGGIIGANRTLGGLAEWVEAQAPDFNEEPVDGAGTIRAATVPVMIRFFTSDPLN